MDRIPKIVTLMRVTDTIAYGLVYVKSNTYIHYRTFMRPDFEGEQISFTIPYDKDKAGYQTVWITIEQYLKHREDYYSHSKMIIKK